MLKSTRNKVIIWFIVGLAFIGFFDATYLTVKHFTGGPLPCYIFSDCDVVTTSRYATVLNIPVALFGSIYYLLLVGLGILFIDRIKLFSLITIRRLAPLGFISSLVLMYLQFFTLRSLCFYCVLSAAVCTIIFILSFFLYTKAEKRELDLAS